MDHQPPSSRASLKAPRAPHVRFREPRNLVPGTEAELLSGGEGLFWSPAHLIGKQLENPRYIECRFEDAVVEDVDLRGLTVAESAVERLSSSHFSAPRSAWRESRVRTSRIGVAELYEAQLDAMVLTGCKLDLVNLRAAQLMDVKISDCTISELDLTAASLTRVRLTDTTVEHLVLHQAQLQDVDLRGAELHRITEVEFMRGATISPLQLELLAPVLAAQVGLVVRAAE